MRLRKTTTQAGLAAAFLVLACASRASAAPGVPVIHNDPAVFGPEFYDGNSVDIVGWTFQVKTPVVVHGLAWYDHGRDGLLQSHLVGLWKVVVNTPGRMFFPLPQDLTLLTTLEIPSGTSAPLDGPWRRVNFEAAITLEPGDYELAGTVAGLFGDRVQWAPLLDRPVMVHDDRFIIGLPAYHLSASGLEPANDFFLAFGAELGPMLFVEPVPEPSSARLAIMGGLVWLFRSRATRQQRMGGCRR